jgi:hypothetical protein
MYQSAQCKGQFIYSRFRNIGDTFDMYANASLNDGPIYKYDASFSDGDIVYERGEMPTTEQFDDIEEYNKITGSNVNSIGAGADKILNRLPMTWKKVDSATVRNVNDRRTLIRISNYNGNELDVNKASLRMSKRLSSLVTPNTSTYTIVPTIQTAYGFTDLGKILESELTFDNDVNGKSYITTHKIGYEEKDKYAKDVDGKPTTCRSYLFLSPVNHSEIQVDGDTLESSKNLDGGETLRVPLIYQFRMTDYKDNDNIFGKYSSVSSPTVKNTKFANIIGIDIWTDRNSIKPKQYDIIVYSTYGGTIETNTNRTRTSSKQTLINVGGDIVNKLDIIAQESRSLSSRGSNTRSKLITRKNKTR